MVLISTILWKELIWTQRILDVFYTGSLKITRGIGGQAYQ